jgi:hypothetical protein
MKSEIYHKGHEGHEVKNFLLRALSVLCGCLLSFAAASLNAEPNLVTLNGTPVEATLVSVDTTRKLSFRSADRTGSLPFNELVRWGNPVSPKPQILVVLADGSRLLTAAAWAGGVPVRLQEDSLIVLTDVWDEVPLPRNLLRGIVFAQRKHPRDRARLEKAVRESVSTTGDEMQADVVMLTNGDRVVGELTALSGGSLELSTDAGAVKLPLSRVEAVVFGNSRQPSPRPELGTKAAVSHPTRVAVGMSDGTVLNANRVIADENALSVELTDGVKLVGGSVKDVIFLQSLGGPFEYLSDIEPASYRHVPYLSIEWPFERDRNVLGEPLVVIGQRYLKGLGMHSASRITYRLDGNYRRFDAMVAIDDSADQKGSVTFGVYVLRDNQWKSAYTSAVARGGDPPLPISVDVEGAQALTLTVDFADRGDELDHADWLDARLVKK